MTHKNRMSLIGNLQSLVSLLLFLAATVVALAQNPAPLITQPLVPDTRIPGAAGFTLTVNGTGFVSGATVNWNGSSLATTFVSASRLTAKVPASDIANAVTASVTVVNPGPGVALSNVVFLPVSLPVDLAFATSAFSAGDGPRSVTTADLNKDGKLDLVVPDSTGGTVSVLLGNGDGVFQAPVTYTVGQGATNQFFWVAVGDFNGDGVPDFVVSDYLDNYVSVFIGNGDGTFKSGVTYAVGTNPTSVAVADVNRDGKLDLVTSNQNCPNGTCVQATVSILLGNGDGTFQSHSDYAAGLGANWVTVGDFNGDGKLDLAVVNGQGNAYTSAVEILLGNGDGTFQSPVSYPLNTNGASVATADFNRDGKLDLAVADNVGVVSILLGNGNGTFQPRVDYPAGCGLYCSFPFGSISVGDFNQDGVLDLAVSNSGESSISIFLGNGDGTFQPEMDVATGAASGSVPQGVVAGDFTQSGRLDFAVANTSANNVSILLQNGTVFLLPARLNFGAQLIGSGAKKEVTLGNLGMSTLTITGIAISGADAADFTQTNTCGASLGPGAHCVISLTFNPSQLGPRSAAITVSDSDPSSPQSVPLTGIGASSGPNATLSASSLSFAVQLVGTTSAPQLITLSNYGTETLDLIAVAITGPFQQTHTCGKTLAAGASCTVEVTFAPESSGSFNGSLSFTDNAAGSPQTVALTGAGTVVELNPSSLNFGVVTIGNSSNKTTTLTNTGTVALNISGISIAGDATDFSQTNTCAAAVAAGGSCVITVTFRPESIGTKSADVSVADDGGGSPQLVPLSGAGTTCITKKCHEADAISRPTVKSAITHDKAVSVPPVGGPRTVGTRVLRLVDSGRPDPFAADGRVRELLVRFWYPATQRQTCQPAAYASPRVWSYFSQLTGLPLPDVTTNSCQDAAVASGAHPVVIFTPGYTATFTDYTFLLEDLASRGYIVASVDHTYEATALEFPDGRLIPSAVGSHFNSSWRLDESILSLVLATRQADIEFVAKELERMNAMSGGPFNGKLDTSRIGLMGHSLGGEATLTVLQHDTRFRAGVLLEGAIAEESVMPTSTPVLILAAGRERWTKNECDLWNDLNGAHVAVNLQGGEHLTPSDAVWLAKGAIQTGTMGPDRTVAAIRDYVAAFFDENLRGKSRNSLFNGPSLIYPDVAVITKEGALCSQP